MIKFLVRIRVDASKPKGGEILCVILVFMIQCSVLLVSDHLGQDWRGGGERRRRGGVEP